MDLQLFDKKLLPAVTLEDADSALFVAEALLKGGLNVMEVTFRTEATASAIRLIVEKFPSMNVGAGTILSASQVNLAQDAGAQFGLSPGYNDEVIDAAESSNFPFIPGVITPTEIEQALSKDLKLLKLFPVSGFGGAGYVKSLQGPYQHTGVKFIPMGGIRLSNIKEYKFYSSVAALGGSWLVSGNWIAERQFGKITEMVRNSLDIMGH